MADLEAKLWDWLRGMPRRFRERYTSRVAWVDSAMNGRFEELGRPNLVKMGKELFRGMKLATGMMSINVMEVLDIIITEIKEFLQDELNGLFEVLRVTFREVIRGIFSILINLVEETVVYKKYKKHLAPVVEWVHKVEEQFSEWSEQYDELKELYGEYGEWTEE